MPGAQRANLKRRIAIRAALLLLAGASTCSLPASSTSSRPGPSCEAQPSGSAWRSSSRVSTLAFWTCTALSWTQSWFAVGTSQLAGAAAARSCPAAPLRPASCSTGCSSVGPTPAAGGLGACGELGGDDRNCSRAPVMAVLTALGGAPVPGWPSDVAYLGGGSSASSRWPRPGSARSRGTGRFASSGAARVCAAGLVGSERAAGDLPERLLLRRDALRRAFSLASPGWRSWPRSASGASTTSPCFVFWRRFRHNRSPRSSSSRTQRRRSSA